MEEKFVTYRNLKIGQKIKGTKDGGSRSFFTAYVKSIDSAFVMVEKWRVRGKEERINSSVMFCVEMTEDEFESKYREKAKEVLHGIQIKIHGDEIGYHEMWNTWLYGTPYKIAQYCVKEKMRVVGYSSDIMPKTAMFSGETLDVGVCAEYEDGERFWCHYRYSDIENMLERYEELIG